MARSVRTGKPSAAAGVVMGRRSLLKLGGIGVAATATGALSACNTGGGTSKSSKKVSVMVSQSPTAPEGQKRILALLKKKFADQNHGATVDFQVVQLGSAVTTAISTTAASHEGPDIFEIGPNNLPTGAAAGVFTPITDAEWKDLGGKDRYLPTILKAMGKSPDSLVAIPYYASTMAMFYNKSTYAKAGITQPPTTWSDFVEVGQRLSAPSSHRYAVADAAAEPTQPWHVIWLLTTQLGGSFLSADGRTAQLNSDAVLQATSFWLDWMGKYHIVNPRDASNSSAQQVQSFVNKRTAMFPCGFTQAISNMPGTAVENEWALAANPTVPYGQKSLKPDQPAVQTYLGGATWAISKYAKDRDLALRLAKIMGDADVQQLTWKKVGGLPVTKETFTAYPATRAGTWKVIYNAALNAQATPWSPSFPQVTPLLADAVKPSFASLAAHGSYDQGGLRQALDTANRKFQVALDHEGH